MSRSNSKLQLTSTRLNSFIIKTSLSEVRFSSLTDFLEKEEKKEAEEETVEKEGIAVKLEALY